MLSQLLQIQVAEAAQRKKEAAQREEAAAQLKQLNTSVADLTLHLMGVGGSSQETKPVSGGDVRVGVWQSSACVTVLWMW